MYHNPQYQQILTDHHSINIILKTRLFSSSFLRTNAMSSGYFITHPLNKVQHQTSTISWQIVTSSGTLLLSCPSLTTTLEEVRWLGEVWVAVVISYSDPKAVDPSCVLRYDPCLPRCLAWFVHPSLLHSFFFDQCLIHALPLTTLFVHPSLLHCLTFAPCMAKTPPRWAWFIHPLLLHRLICAPCYLHNPSLRAWFVHQSEEHSYLYFFLACPSSNEDFRFFPFRITFALLTRQRFFALVRHRGSFPGWSLMMGWCSLWCLLGLGSCGYYLSLSQLKSRRTHRYSLGLSSF